MSFDIIIPFLRPIEPLLADDDISEIMCNPDSTCWVERDGNISRCQKHGFRTGELHAGLEVIANKFGKQLDASHPILNVRLPDGSRLSAIIPPVVSPEPLLNIRKFGTRNYTLDDLERCGTVPKEMSKSLREAVAARKNILISGATGTGKTTLLNALANEIPDQERIFIIEDTAEIRLRKPHVISSESQSNTHQEDVSFETLLKAALRHRPDRIILGEVRSVEARMLLDAMNTGHDGTLTTIHASSPEGALRRLASLAQRVSGRMSMQDSEDEVYRCIGLVAQMVRNAGHRSVIALKANEGQWLPENL